LPPSPRTVPPLCRPFPAGWTTPKPWCSRTERQSERGSPTATLSRAGSTRAGRRPRPGPYRRPVALALLRPLLLGGGLLRLLGHVVADRALVVQRRQLSAVISCRGRTACGRRLELWPGRELLQRLPPQGHDADRDQAGEEQDPPPDAQCVRAAPQDQ